MRSTTIHAAQNQGMNLTLDQFQIASNSLARQVLSSIVNQGVIRDMDYIISEDVQSVVRDLGLTPEGWAGTVMGGLPVEFGGLGLGYESEFYDYLIQNLRFDDATKQLPNLSNQLIDSMKYQISNAQDFYTTYKIPYNDHNKQIVDELSNKYKTHMLNTTPCRHDKTGQTMRISCWKCN